MDALCEIQPGRRARFDETSRACVATARGVAVAMDLKSRKSIELPEARRRRIEAGLLRLPR